MALTPEEKKARARAYYEARTPEQKAKYRAKSDSWHQGLADEKAAERLSRGLLPGHSKPTPTPEEVAAASRERSSQWRANNIEHARELDRIKARRLAAEKKGIELTDEELYRPKAEPLTEEEKRDRRRVKSAEWRAGNPERAREITRDSMRRTTAERAIAEGREPGKKGVPKKFTEEEKRAKRKAKSEKWNAAHADEVREKARIREAAKRAGTFVSKARGRLTEEEARLVQVMNSAARRVRIRSAGGAEFTVADIVEIQAEQGGFCLFCALPFGEEEIHIDHWIPVIRGGSNGPENIALLHGSCNLKKGPHMPSEFGLPDTPRERRDALKLQRTTEGKNT